MKKISLAAVLLFCLVTPFMMTYRLSSGETPYWLFGLVFLFLLSYLGLDLISLRKKERLRSILLWLIIVLVIGGASWSAILVRHRASPTYQIHDITLQLEEAVRFFLQGQNPYATTYFGTFLEDWHFSDTVVNPALYHFVMMPWYLLFSLPFRFLSVSLLGFWDGRMPLLFLFFFLLILAWCLFKKKRHLFLTLLAFNPATLGYLLEGRSDVFMFAFLFGALFFLAKKRYPLAGASLALAFATKQSVWPIFPFYCLFIWLKSKKDWWKTTHRLLPFALVFGLIALPFLFWDGTAFLNSTVFYLSGSTPHSYPISGYGWGMVLSQLGIIQDLQTYYPFWLWQAAACVPLLIILGRWLIKSASIWRLVVSYGIFTLVFWYFSRYFNNSHLGYLSMVFLTAWGFGENEKD